jgi:hypothetical protein
MPGIGGIEPTRLLTAMHPHLVVLPVSIEEPERRVMAACARPHSSTSRYLASRVLREVWRDHRHRCA